MNRMFDEHIVRKTRSLNGTWKMMPDLEGGHNWKNGLPDGARNVAVPSCWNFELDLFGFEGVGWYEKDFHTEAGRVMLEFEGISGQAEVYLDGALIASHYGSFTAFSAEAYIDEGFHKLVISADNRFTDDTIPARYVDWYNYGGIFRGVTLHMTPDAYIRNCHYTYELDKYLENAVVTAELTVSAQKAAALPVEIKLNGESVLKAVISVQAGIAAVRLPSFEVNDVHLWDTKDPFLYNVELTIPNDDMIDRIGFRKIETCGKKILLNGEEVYFRGVNHHEEQPDFGFAVPAQLAQRDLRILQKLHVNSVRGSHYPNSRMFVDMLDEAGILFWSEIPMWGFPKERMSRPEVLKRGLEMHREMAEQYYNHPCIVIWGLNNECETGSQEALTLAKQFAACLRENGGNRLITYATNHFKEDICFEVADFISVNEYHGWYGGSAKEWADFIPAMRQHLCEKGAGDKPIVMSEFGAAGLYGYSSFDSNKWTEEYQADLVTDVISRCAAEDGVVGTFVWQFSDIRSEEAINRARSFNNKGLLNEYRKPKQAFYAVSQLYEMLSEND